MKITVLFSDKMCVLMIYDNSTRKVEYESLSTPFLNHLQIVPYPGMIAANKDIVYKLMF